MALRAVATAEPAPRPVAERPRVALIGNPNTGKTSLFNVLCGVRAKTANFPGTTTDVRIGRAELAGAGTPLPVEVIDLPGLYRVAIDLPEARMCREILAGEGLFRPPDAVVVVVDATNLVRNLYLVGELLTYDLPVVVALNMIDLAQRRGLSIDTQRLAQELGCPVLPIVARRGEGVGALAATLAAQIHDAAPRRPPAELCAAMGTNRAATDFDALERWAEQVATRSVGGESALGAATDTVLERLDQTFTHPIVGLIVFGLVMGALFWTIFALATVPMDLIEATFSGLSAWVETHVPPGAIRDLLAGGVIGGIAGTVVFLPQICLLFFLISLLEDTGYLARAAFVMDRLLCRFGLPGYAFVPLLASHACALPGIMSTKLIPDRQDRLATILVAPFMSCSARLPVYVLLTGLLFANRPFLAGLAFAGCYVLGALAALGSAWIARRTLLPGRSRAMVLELPTYKLPSLRSAFLQAFEQGIAFLRTAGTVILAICVIMWWLSAYPVSEPPAEAVALRAEAAVTTDAAAAEALGLRADALTQQAHQANSFAGRIGQTLEPMFAPLGCDWQLTVAVLTSFLAREVFVSTLAVLAIPGADAEEPEGVLDAVHGAVRADGTPLLDPVTSASLLVFFVLAMQCLPTLAMTRKETGSWRWAALQLVYMSSLAYVLAFGVRQLLLLVGFGG